MIFDSEALVLGRLHFNDIKQFSFDKNGKFYSSYGSKYWLDSRCSEELTAN